MLTSGAKQNTRLTWFTLLFALTQFNFRTGIAILKNRELAISMQRFDRLAQSLACWWTLDLRTLLAFKISNFYKFKMADRRHLEKWKNGHIYRNAAATAFHLGCRITTGTPFPPHRRPAGVPVHSGTTTPLAYSCTKFDDFRFSHSMDMIEAPKSSRVVATSVLYLMVHGRIAGDVPIYLNFALKVTYPFKEGRFRQILLNTAAGVWASEKVQLSLLGSCQCTFHRSIDKTCALPLFYQRVLFVRSLLWAGVQPTLDPSAETFMSVQCAGQGRGGELVGVCGVCASCVGWRKG